MLRSFLGGRLFAETFDLADADPSAEVASPTSVPVVALHGWGRSRADLAPLVAATGGWSLDLPGFGASPEPPEVWGAAEYAHLVAEFCDEQRIRPVVVGHSMGGRIAVCLAAHRPDLVAGLVITGAPLLRLGGGRSSAPWSYRTVRRLHRWGLITDARMEAARQRHGSADYRAARGVMRDVLVRMVNEDYRDELGRVTVPTALVWGLGDTAAPTAVADAAHELLSDSTLQVLDGIGHDTPRDAGPELLAATRRILEQVGSNGSRS